ncbi:LamB/YcsF family protein [Burkholderia gladioli]|uniref:5-oxoprolinase subunit A n=2 Tax=Burkholderia TaxID=32008 RepID=F2LD75_BURGS|nr:5-oxoprolinase subunit PxpA [Burkholderia gladioli]AEA59934.1 LamB/YcsF family protein [Burkholderia gladioli BSR3]MBW5286246.1 LamB/YcsF family protein [Burkholderia gladioli]
MRTELDFNSDLGESFGVYRLGNDAAVLPHVSSANIACGFHAGDPRTIARTVKAARAAGAAIGAHPGYPDLVGFGRREMQLSAEELYEITVYQVGAVKAFAEAAGSRLSHVKPHGALYNLGARRREIAEPLCAAVRDVDPGLIFYGLAGSALVEAARDAGLAVAQEVFADRTYQDDGTLTPRSDPRALITDIEISIRQVFEMLREGVVTSVNGVAVPIQADTLCIHGDQPGAALFAQRIRAALDAAGIAVRPPGARLPATAAG